MLYRLTYLALAVHCDYRTEEVLADDVEAAAAASRAAVEKGQPRRVVGPTRAVWADATGIQGCDEQSDDDLVCVRIEFIDADGKTTLIDSRPENV